MGWVNLTPYVITLVRPEGNIMFPPSGQVASCAFSAQQTGWVVVEGRNVPVCQSAFGEVSGLPNPTAGTYYIVTPLVAEAAAGRTDVFYPEGQVLDQAGNPIGCWGLGVKTPRQNPSSDKGTVRMGPLKRLGWILRRTAQVAVIATAALIALWVIGWVASF